MNPTVLGLLLIAFLSTIIGWFFCHSKQVEKPVKIMLFVLYFWSSAFVQLTIFALLYKAGFLGFIR